MKSFSKIKKLDETKRKQGGFVMTSELLLLASVAVIGLVVGLGSVRDSVNAELYDTAAAIGAINQSYAFDGTTNSTDSAVVQGSGYTDTQDGNDASATLVYVAPAALESDAAAGAGAINGGVTGVDAFPAGTGTQN